MARRPFGSSSRTEWWEVRRNSILVFMVTLVVLGLVAAVLVDRVRDAIPAVGRDAEGTDPWVDPLGLEGSKSGFVVVRTPDCALAPVTSVALWDEDSRPYWEVSGPPTPLPAFVLGAAPAGFRTVTPYRQPPDGAVVRVVLNRRLLGVAGARFTSDELVPGVVVSHYGGDYHSFSRSGFQTAAVCQRDEEDEDTDKPGTPASSSSSVPAGSPAG